MPRSWTGVPVKRFRVVLVDDNDDFLDGVSECLGNQPEFLIVGRAHTGQQTLADLEEVSADLYLVDMSLPDMSGLEVTRRIKSNPDAPIVVLMTLHESAAARLVANAAGADGLISETGLRDQLVPLVAKLLNRPVSDRQTSEGGTS